MNEFEKQLQSQPLRKIPAAWRREILAAAAEAKLAPAIGAKGPGASWLSTLNSQLITFLWPHPKAWGALAAAWALICALNFESRDTSQTVVAQSAPPTPEIRMALRQQKILLAELIEQRETPVAERPKLKPRPRSERRIEQVIV